MVKKKTILRKRVSKPYSKVTKAERAPKEPRCTLCEEDQRSIQIGKLPTVKICYIYAQQVEDALRDLLKNKDFKITSLQGYRVGRTRGAIKNGMRSELSNHSFGTAIDINRGQNGLYKRCKLKHPAPQRAEDLKGCRLAHGGAWDPRSRPRTTITRGGPVFEAFKSFWRWGGEIPGATKDFMHFSLTGE